MTWGGGGVVWLGCIVLNTVYNHFWKKTLWVDDKHVELDIIRLYYVYIALTIQWYEHIPGIYVLDMVYILYCDNSPKFHSRNQLVHVKISITQIL